jgi:hypothetical protein
MTRTQTSLLSVVDNGSSKGKKTKREGGLEGGGGLVGR